MAYSFADSPPSPQLSYSWLELSVSAAKNGSVVVGAAAVVAWLDPTPLPDDQPGTRVHVTLATGCPTTNAGLVGVTNDGADLDRALLPQAAPTAGLGCHYTGMNGAAGTTNAVSDAKPETQFRLAGSTRLDAHAAQALATTVSGFRLSHLTGGTSSCPMDDARIDLVVLAYPNRPDIDLWWSIT